MPTLPSITSRLAPRRLGGRWRQSTSRPRAVAIEHAGVAGADAHVGGHADVLGTSTRTLPMPMLSSSGVRPARQVDVAQVDAQLADAELVAVAQLGEARGPVVAVADAAVDVDPGRGDEAERDRDDRAPAARASARRRRSRHAPAPRRSRSRGRRSRRRRRRPRPPRRRRSRRPRRRSAGCASPARRSTTLPSSPRFSAARQSAAPSSAISARPNSGGPTKNRPGPSSTHAAMHEDAGAGEVSARLRPAGASPGDRVGGDEQPGRGVGEQAGAAGERQHDEPDAEDDRVDVEVAPEAAGDAAEHPVGGGAGEAAGSPRSPRWRRPAGAAPAAGAPDRPRAGRRR